MCEKMRCAVRLRSMQDYQKLRAQELKSESNDGYSVTYSDAGERIGYASGSDF